MQQQSNNFDGVRLTGALLVLFSHQFALSGRWEPRFVGDHSFGNLGVLCFFAISGYLVSISWKRDPNPKRFLIRRFLRVIPGLAVSVAVTYGVVFSLGLIGFPGNPMPLLNGSLWTIPLEIACYFLLMGVALIFRNAAPVFLASMLATFWLTSGQLTSLFFLAYFGIFFGCGSLLSQFDWLRTTKTSLTFFVIGLALLIVDQTIFGLAFIVPSTAIAIGSASWPVIRSAGRYGDLSYGIYIYAWPVQQIIVHWLGPK